MRLLPLSSALAAVCIAAGIVAGCSAAPTAAPSQSLDSIARSNSGSIDFGVTGADLKKPALLAVNSGTGALEYWPIKGGGGVGPTRLSHNGIFSGSGLVADGHVVAFGNAFPPEVITFDVLTKAKNTLPDPFGTPIDIAVGKDDSLYVINFTKGPTNVTMYPGGRPNPKKLMCRYSTTGEEVAVDNEGDIFVNGYENNGTGVVEIPNGPDGPEPQKCKELTALQPETGYTAGLQVDPKTDALIVLNDPDECAGGEEGRMTIYHKPYRASTAVVHDIGQNCTGGMKLNADSSIVFVGDQDVSGSFTFILQRSYPDGTPLGNYQGGAPGSFATIPNTLPN